MIYESLDKRTSCAREKRITPSAPYGKWYCWLIVIQKYMVKENIKNILDNKVDKEVEKVLELKLCYCYFWID